MCNVEFGSMEGLKRHLDMIHLRCAPCNIQFRLLDQALSHKRVHEKEALMSYGLENKNNEEELLKEQSQLINLSTPISLDIEID